jgi:ABC-type antimicrobial peptide transport system permease subunit
MLSQPDRYALKIEDHVFRAQGCYASEDLFFMFSFPLIAGDPVRCLTAGDQIVISEKMAVNYFGRFSPLGKPIRIDNTKDYFVSGVFKDIPENSSLQFDFLLPFKEYEDLPWAKDWEAIGDRTFVLLERGASVESLQSKIKFFLKGKLPESKDQLGLQPFTRMYLYSDFKAGVLDGGRIDNVRIFGWVAVLLLVVACINFMNLSTAQSVERSKEIGIRKVIGAGKFLLVRQFMGEAALTVVSALALSLVVVEMTLPWFSQFTAKNLHLPYTSLQFIGALFALAVFTAIASGVYPALFLSSMAPTSALKGMSRISRGALDFRRSLVVFQFFLSTLFIVATIVVGDQLKYIHHKDLGLDRENVIYQTFEGELRNNFDAFSAELSNAPGIQSVTYSNQPLLDITHPSTWVEWPGKDREVVFAVAGVGYDYVKTMKIEMVSGRDFSRQISSDSANVLVNEAAVKQMGLASPLGHEITTRRDIKRKGKIIAVMRDFHLQSLRAPIEPLYLFLDPDPGFGFVTVRTQAGKTQEALASMKEVNRKFNPFFPFEYTFAEDDFNRLYNTDATLQQLAKAFSGITILVSCLGLFGLTAFSAEQRTREIGIRKVLGASISGILRLLSTDFIRLVLIALIIAAPFAWYGMDRWLQGYAYRIEFSWWSIGIAGGMMLLLTILTITSQVLRVATRNPVQALRAE